MTKKGKPEKLHTPLLFDDLEETPAPPKEERPQRPTIQSRFVAFHAANPHVLQRLREYAYEAKRAGCKRIGMKMLWERLRWWAHVEVSNEGEEFKLSNDFTSRYARHLADGNPDLADLFETRKLRRR